MRRPIGRRNWYYLLDPKDLQRFRGAFWCAVPQLQVSLFLWPSVRLYRQIVKINGICSIRRLFRFERILLAIGSAPDQTGTLRRLLLLENENFRPKGWKE